MMWRDTYQSARGGGGPRGEARFVGDSPPMRDLKKRILWVAGEPFPVVIKGRVGHGQGAGRPGDPRGGSLAVPPPSPVNCAVLGDELFESELFRHAKDAFTGPGQDRKGLLELSSGWTVFLDEVAELTPGAQAKLLRVLQDSRSRPARCRS